MGTAQSAQNKHSQITWAGTCPGTAGLDVQDEPSGTCWGCCSSRGVRASQQEPRSCCARRKEDTEDMNPVRALHPYAQGVWLGSPGCAALRLCSGTCSKTPKDKQNKQQGQRQPKNPAMIPVPTTNLWNTAMTRGIFNRWHHVSRLGCF